MIISRTPFRISFFGGGTDYPAWRGKHGGSVLSTSIDKYCYITLRYLPPFFEHRIRLLYSKIEMCQTYEEILHPAVRETLRFLNFDRGLEIHHDGDLPARSGMGSSSSFVVGLLHALYALRGVVPTKKQLVMESIHIEQNMIRETVGSQDQAAAAYGGLNHIAFGKDGEIDVRPVDIPESRQEELMSNLMLFFTGINRTGSEIAESYVDGLLKKESAMLRMQEHVDKGISILRGDSDMRDFGECLHETWMLKRDLGSEITNGGLDELYIRARKNGAIGGKITGAGGGGFLLLFAPPSEQPRLREALNNLLYVPFRFEKNGSQIIFCDPQIQQYEAIEREREIKTQRSRGKQ